jgi:hypothetical protein
LVLISFKHSCYGSVFKVFHPPGNAETIRSAFGFHSEKNALHPTADDYMGSDFVVHDYPTNNWLERYEAGRLEG